VLEYKVPKEDDEIDELTLQIRDSGVAPEAILKLERAKDQVEVIAEEEEILISDSEEDLKGILSGSDQCSPLRCAEPPDQLRSEISSSPTCNIPNLILYITHSLRNAPLVVCLHGCAIACALKRTFAQCKIFLEGTLVVM